MANEQEERNKQVVARFFDEVVMGPGDNLDLLDELVAEDYYQRNPHAGQGREGLRAFFEKLLPLPARGPETVNLIADGDLVVRQAIREQGMLIDVMRVQDGMLVEHWDAYRPNPGTERLPGF